MEASRGVWALGLFSWPLLLRLLVISRKPYFRITFWLFCCWVLLMPEVPLVWDVLLTTFSDDSSFATFV